jgi:hypothetical protein
MVRIAEGQHADVEFVDPDQIGDLPGVAALLRF